MKWMNLLGVVIIILCRISFSRSSPDAVSTGEHDDAPWMWLSTDGGGSENNAGARVLEVVEVVDDPQEVGTTADLTTEPRFVGHLRKKLCKVGLGLGHRDEFCGTQPERNRVRRSAQFMKSNEDGSTVGDVAGSSSQTMIRKADRQGVVAQTSGRIFGGNGLDGLTRLLNPYIDPSFGVHFGGIPYGYGGYYGGYYGGGHSSPFQFNLGPLSINPLGGIRFTLRNGRPLIRPTIDFLIAPKAKKHYPYPYSQGNYYHNRFVRDVEHPYVAKASNSNPVYIRNTPKIVPSVEVKIPNKLSNKYNIITNKPPHKGFNFQRGKKSLLHNLGPSLNTHSSGSDSVTGYGKSIQFSNMSDNNKNNKGLSVVNNKYKNILTKPPHDGFNFPKAKKVVFYDSSVRKSDVSEDTSEDLVSPSVGQGFREAPLRLETSDENRDDIYAKQ